MKKLIVSFVLVLVLIGCKKDHKTPSTLHQVPGKISQDVPKCGNDVNPEFAAKMLKARRSREGQEIVNKRKPKDNPDLIATPTVIFLDTDGHTVENTLWNWSGQPFLCADSRLTTEQTDLILRSVVEDFSSFNVIVTADELVYAAAPKDKRVRVIITLLQGLNDFFPPSGGVAIIGSLWFGDDTPCFVFADAFGWNSANIAEAVSHEAGHTIGLLHQSEFLLDGTYKYEYHSGFFSVPWNIYWKPIMGGSYNGDISGWMEGRNLAGSQNDTELLSIVGLKTDHEPNFFSMAKEIKVNGSGAEVVIAGLINRQLDIDFYSISSGDIAFSINPGGNCDLQVVVYNESEEIIAEFNDSNNLGISEKVINTNNKKIYLKVFPNQLLLHEIQSAGQYSLVIREQKRK